MKNKILFTSESVSEGHPDKVCDQIADAILDECLKQDKKSRVACEVLATNNKIVLAGEITSKAKININKIVKDVIKDIGYTKKEYGFTYKNVKVINMIKKQSLDIAMGVDQSDDVLGAGDQGIMFGFATNEDKTSYMPLPLMMAHRIVQLATSLRKKGILKYARPDMKSQVTIDYTSKDNLKVDTIIFSCQHDENIDFEHFKTELKTKVIDVVLKEYNFDKCENILINPTGRFVIGGPVGDTGLTGRKLIVDTYGGFVNHGGGAFSGKDPSKVDRSASYMARYVCKNLVASGMCDKCMIQLSYAIGYPKPISIYLDTYNTEKIDKNILLSCIKDLFDFTPKGMIDTLRLLDDNIRYRELTNYGHFGKNNFSFEQLDMVDKIKEYVKKASK